MPDCDKDSGLVLNHPRRLPGVKEDKNDTEVPVREITANQVIAWNMARFRRAASLTQEELGLKIGWSGSSVSEAERSWDGRRTREFDAQSLALISLAIGVPIMALFLPPADDGTEAHYVITGPDGRQWEMADYMERCVMPDSESDLPPVLMYRDRFNTAFNRYLATEWPEEAADFLRSIRSPDDLRQLAARLLDREQALLQTAAELRSLSGAFLGDLK